MKLFWSAIALAFTVFAIIAISFSITAGASYLICWAFGIAWSFKIAFGVWCMLALVSIFLRPNSKKE